MFRCSEAGLPDWPGSGFLRPHQHSTGIPETECPGYCPARSSGRQFCFTFPHSRKAQPPGRSGIDAAETSARPPATTPSSMIRAVSVRSTTASWQVHDSQHGRHHPGPPGQDSSGHPEPDGSYQIQRATCFLRNPKDFAEIYIMGCRNPFQPRPEIGLAVWGDVGPDALESNPARGRWIGRIQSRSPPATGWPFLAIAGLSAATISATRTPEKHSDPYTRSMESRNNTRTGSPCPARDDLVSPSASALSGNGIRGQIRHGGTALPYVGDYPESSRRFPTSLDQALFVFEWEQKLDRTIRLDANGRLVRLTLRSEISVRRPFPWHSPEGALYTCWNGEPPGRTTRTLNWSDRAHFHFQLLPMNLRRIQSRDSPP